jgi:hypothetical protein
MPDSAIGAHCRGRPGRRIGGKRPMATTTPKAPQARSRPRHFAGARYRALLVTSPSSVSSPEQIGHLADVWRPLGTAIWTAVNQKAVDHAEPVPRRVRCRAP